MIHWRLKSTYIAFFPLHPPFYFCFAFYAYCWVCNWHANHKRTNQPTQTIQNAATEPMEFNVFSPLRNWMFFCYHFSMLCWLVSCKFTIHGAHRVLFGFGGSISSPPNKPIRACNGVLPLRHASYSWVQKNLNVNEFLIWMRNVYCWWTSKCSYTHEVCRSCWVFELEHIHAHTFIWCMPNTISAMKDGNDRLNLCHKQLSPEYSPEIPSWN